MAVHVTRLVSVFRIPHPLNRSLSTTTSAIAGKRSSLQRELTVQSSRGDNLASEQAHDVTMKRLNDRCNNGGNWALTWVYYCYQLKRRCGIRRSVVGTNSEGAGLLEDNGAEEGGSRVCA